jgi:hypothetical protein
MACMHASEDAGAHTPGNPSSHACITPNPNPTTPDSLTPSCPFLPPLQAMLTALIPRASYPPDFTTWHACFDLDQSAFGRLREQILPEMLEVAFGLLRLEYLDAALRLLGEAASWQAAEVALYLMRCACIVGGKQQNEDAIDWHRHPGVHPVHAAPCPCSMQCVSLPATFCTHML